jgi:hypothetical protein
MLVCVAFARWIGVGDRIDRGDVEGESVCVCVVRSSVVTQGGGKGSAPPFAGEPADAAYCRLLLTAHGKVNDHE